MQAIRRGSALAVLLFGAAAAVSVSPAHATYTAKATGQIYVIQGVPGSTVDVTVDGKSVASGAAAKDIIGPLHLSTGSHEISFDAEDWSVDKSFEVDHASQDVVVHWPADITDSPEVTVFNNDVNSVAAGKARLTVAHTAVVPPADIRVDGKVLFANIANGEFVSAVVPASTYSVDIVPTGQSTDPLLGPVDLPVKAGVLTRVFAIGVPKDGSMDAVVQVIPVNKGGSPAPGSVDAGEAGLAATNEDTSGAAVLVPAMILAALSVLGLTIAGLRRGRASR